MQNTWLYVHAGATGALLAGTPKSKDLCWTFGTTVYPTQQWTDLGVLFGDETKTVALSPYYAKIAQFATWSGTAFTYQELDYPSTAALTSTPRPRPTRTALASTPTTRTLPTAW